MCLAGERSAVTQAQQAAAAVSPSAIPSPAGTVRRPTLCSRRPSFTLTWHVALANQERKRPCPVCREPFIRGQLKLNVMMSEWVQHAAHDGADMR